MFRFRILFQWKFLLDEICSYLDKNCIKINVGYGKTPSWNIEFIKRLFVKRFIVKKVDFLRNPYFN